MIDMVNNAPPFTPEQFAHLGDGQVAYVKPMTPEDVQKAFPQVQMQGVQPGMKLFALLSATGMPLMLTDSRDAAVANAWENQLQTVSVH
jgi:hypothetical protein